MNKYIISVLIMGFYFINRVSSSASIISIVNITNSVHASYKNNNDRIVNGMPAPVNKFPYQVMLLIRTSERTGKCGGTILNEYHIITAAHCVVVKQQIPASDVKVLAGHVSYLSPKMFAIDVKKVIVHEKYDESTTDYDIAVLKLKQRLPLGTPGFEAIDNLERGRIDEGTKCIVSGWGTHGEKEIVDEDHLYYTYLYHINSEKCAKLLKGWVITPRMICFEYKGKPTDACVGDSGGPLVCDNILVGVVSWGSGSCALPNSPGVYTNVSNLRSWILSVAGT